MSVRSPQPSRNSVYDFIQPHETAPQRLHRRLKFPNQQRFYTRDPDNRRQRKVKRQERCDQKDAPQGEKVIARDNDDDRRSACPSQQTCWEVLFSSYRGMFGSTLPKTSDDKLRFKEARRLFRFRNFEAR